MARPSDRAPLRRQEILENFYAVLRDEGLEGASLARIARSMGVHPSLLIHYFSTKDQMTLALVDYIMAGYEATYTARFSSVADPGERLEVILDTLFGAGWMKHVDQSVFFACHYLGFYRDEIQKRFRRMYEGFRRLLTAEFAELMDSGVVRRMDPALAADLVIAMTEGLDFYGTVIGTGKRFGLLGTTLKRAAMSLLAADGSIEAKATEGAARRADDAAGPDPGNGGRSG